MSEFHPEWLADLGPWHAVGDTPFLARCLPSDPDGAILILRPWGPWEEQRWRAVFSPPDRDDDGQDWRHGEILTPDGRYWPDRESAEDALDAAWSAWRARYRASRGVAPNDGRRHTLLVALTPSLLARIEALGFEVGSEGVLPWLVGVAEEMRDECAAFATYREATTTALGIESSSCAEDVAEAVNEMRLTLAAEQGKAEGVPNFSGMEWMDDVKVWRAALLRLVGGRTDHLRAMFGEEIVRAAVAWGDNDSARWDNLSAPEQAHWVADYIERAAMVAADKAIGQPAAEWRRPYRNLIHVLDVIDDRVMLSIPGWRSRWFVERTLDVFAPELRETVARDRYYFGNVNVGAESSDDLTIEVTELAPPPDPEDEPTSEEVKNAGRPSNVLLTLTPHLKARIEALGFDGAPSDALAWLVCDAEKLRRSRDFHVAHLDAIRAVLSDPSRVVDGVFDSAGKVAAMARELLAVKAARDEARATAEEMRLTLAAEQAKAPPALPFEAQALARFYTTETIDTDQEFWRCLACGCEWPCDIVTACANCHGPKETT